MKRLLLAATVILASCAGETYDSPVPQVAIINYTCNITTVNAIHRQTQQTQLSSPMGYVRIYDRTLLMAGESWGVGGLLLLQSADGHTFYAFDLACPYCYSKGYNDAFIRRIDMSDDGITALCSDCHSEFGSVIWGSPAPTDGPANRENMILRQYRAYILSDGYSLVVTK